MGALQEILFLKIAATTVLAAGLVATALLRSRSAALRGRVLAVAVLVVFALPALAPLLPRPAAFVSPATQEAAPLSATADGSRPARAETTRPAATEAAQQPWPALLVAGIWLAGAAAAGARLLGAHRAARGLVRAARPFLAVPVSGGAARVLVSPTAPCPAVVGWLRPVIVLPPAAHAWLAPELTAVLRHEQAHVARGDNAVALVAGIVAAVHWCDPLAWLVAARLRREAEAACDDAVVDAGVRPSAYARVLLHHARAAVPTPVAAAAPFASHAVRRLRRVLDTTADRRPPGGRATLAAACLLLVAALPATALRPAAAPVAVTPGEAYLRAGEADSGPAWWREVKDEIREARAVRAWKRDPARGTALPAGVALELPGGWTAETRDAVLLPGAKFGCVFTSESGYVRVSRDGERFALEAAPHPRVDRTTRLIDRILTPLGYGCGGDYRAYRFVGWRTEPNLAVLRAAMLALAATPHSSVREVEP